MNFGLALKRQKSETVDLLINALALERQKQCSSSSHVLALKIEQYQLSFHKISLFLSTDTRFLSFLTRNLFKISSNF
jgi:hypothetical protein